MWCPAHSRNDLHIHFLPSLQLCCLCLGQSSILPCGAHITVPVAATGLSSKADWPLPLLLRSTCTPHTCPAHATSSRRGPCQAPAWHVPRGDPGEQEPRNSRGDLSADDAPVPLAFLAGVRADRARRSSQCSSSTSGASTGALLGPESSLCLCFQLIGEVCLP